MPIKNLPKHLRPREKARENGITSLDDIELLALFLRSGYKDLDVIELSKKLLKEFGTIKRLVSTPYSILRKFKGLGFVKTLELNALYEIYQRIKYERLDYINNLNDAINFSNKIIGNSRREEFLIICLNNKNEIIYFEKLYKGIKNQVLVKPPEIITVALKVSADKIYCAHNHPSGSLIPSKADIGITQAIANYVSLFNFQLVAHIIVNGENGKEITF